MLIDCPNCDTEFSIKEWLDFECPTCGKVGHCEEDSWYDEEGYWDFSMIINWY